MLALEEVYDVTFVKDGQEAYDTVKSNMEKGYVFDLIFMDIQVRNVFFFCFRTVVKILINTDADPRWSREHPTYTPDGIFCTHRRIECFCRRKQH